MGAGMRRRAGKAVFCLVLLGLTLGALGHVAVQAKKVEVAVLLAKEQALHDELLAQQRHLRNEIRQLKDPRRLVYVAQTKLGMTPQSAGIRVVKPRAGLPAAVTGAAALAPEPGQEARQEARQEEGRRRP
jgi:cell division protein FtsL